MASSLALSTTQQEVTFHEDRILVILMPDAGQESTGIWVPIRPICEQLGLSWSGQFERVKRDPVLSSVSKGIRVTRTPQGGGEQEMLCLPLEFLNGWLFGVSAARVKSQELRNKLIIYQRECYGALWRAFAPQVLSALEQVVAPAQLENDLYHLQVGINGILDYLWQRHRHDEVMHRLLEAVRLDLHEVGGRLEDGNALTEQQRLALYQLGLEIVALLGQLGERRNPFALVFGALKKRFKVNTYREIPRAKYRQAHEFLNAWKQDAKHQITLMGDEPCIL